MDRKARVYFNALFYLYFETLINLFNTQKYCPKNSNSVVSKE
ncbi:hypothetical protein HMPREF0758_3363 [Serratia odorifera DSM 4582]|uniref:Uncharacterized protein n=1 Tax=Serratia odorifera DSM 4582 TaxID=667129 RepID=D4E5B3_SEROD|nr:hypothetical protein HMPREF0758_3363 [Serratia odorifera DSM 4582]